VTSAHAQRERFGGKPVPGMWQNNRYDNSWFAPEQSPSKGTPRVLSAMRDLDAMELVLNNAFGRKSFHTDS
jgi:hypothetical protein